MNVTCEGCATVYRVDPAKVPAGGVRARCASCDQVFWVRVEAAAERATTAAPSTMSVQPAADNAVAAPAPAPTAAAADVRSAPVAVDAAPEPTFSPLQTTRIDAAPDVTPVTAPEPTADPLVRGPLESPPAVPSTPAFARPAFGAAALRPTTPAPTAQELVPPAAVADATRVVPPPAPPPVSTVPSASPVADRTSPPVPPVARESAPAAPPVRAGAATSALGGILPADEFAPPAPRAAAPAASAPKAVVPRPPNPFLQQDPAARTRRLARALVSDMVTYHPAKKADGLRDGTLKQLFEEEIRKSWEEYAEQVGRETAESTPHFRDALNDILADGRLIF